MKKLSMLLTIVLTMGQQAIVHAQEAATDAEGQEIQQDAANNARENDESTRASQQSAIDEQIGRLSSFMDWLQAARGWDEVRNFNPNACAPDFSANANAMMPSTCTNNQACNECYERAVGELNFIRRQLGRLNCIYQMTKKFNESAISFGDATSGVHAVTGLSWQTARAGIRQQFDQFKLTYDRKYVDMIGSLNRALLSISECEGRYGLPDWYQRFGFIYYEFMKDKYKRTD